MNWHIVSVVLRAIAVLLVVGFFWYHEHLIFGIVFGVLAAWTAFKPKFFRDLDHFD